MAGPNNNSLNVGIFVFDDAEVLDFCGPFEVLSVANRFSDSTQLDVFLVAEKKSPVIACHGLSVNPKFGFGDCPAIDWLLVPGGIGTRRELESVRVLDWIKQQAAEASLVLSVCTGALLLGAAGLLEGLEITTHHVAYDLLREVVPSGIVHEDRRFVDSGRVITSAGISAGIDMSLHVVEQHMGKDAADATARQMEYNRP